MGGYDFRIWCDHIDHGWHLEKGGGHPDEWCVRTCSEGLREAKKAGWLIRKDGTCLCPRHRKAAKAAGGEG